MKQGKLIVIEGASDGIGKSTQYDMLYNRLIQDGESVVKHHFPTYNTYHGALVEHYLSGDFGEVKDLSPYFINSLYAIDRGVTWYSGLKQAYLEGKTILLDRYTTSSLMYQSALITDIEEKKKFIDYVVDFEYEKIGIKSPDNVIFLYAPFDLITKMRANRKQNDGIENDIHERDIEFMKKVYDSAMFVAEYLGWNMIRCDDGDKMKSVDDIHEEVYRLVKKKK